ncbi:MAG: BamA/TamA family outer membrane protein [Prevotellaceae bacterium]|jgi:outer membrane protein assembly factor BamA|nr:BamA/TamA family outer membrane protein [Prevotellaceae bacterium]
MRFDKRFIFAFILTALFLSSCSSTKFVPEGKYLLNKVEIKSDEKTQSEKELSHFLRQEPNFKVFGLYRLYLSIYNLSGRDSTKWRNRTLRAMGEPPVIYDPFLTYRSEKELQKYMQTKGYIHAEVTSDVEYKKKKAIVAYTVTANEPYRVRHVGYNFAVDAAIDSFMLERGLRNSLLKEGMLFDTDVLDGERERIIRLLRRQGYFHFSKEYLSYTADSSLNSNQVDITLNLKPYVRVLPDGTVEEGKHKKYKIRQINIFTLKNSRSTGNLSSAIFDTVVHKPGIYVFFENRKPLIRPKLIEDELRILPGQLYNELQVERTYARFNSLGVIRSTNIQFNDVKNDSNLLDCSISLMPAKLQSLSLDLEGTNSWGDLGFATNLGYQHRNIFRGSELLSVKLRYAQEAYSGISDILQKNTRDIGGDVSLNFPRFMFPFLSRPFKQRINSQTEFNFGYNYQIRPNTFERTLLTMGMKYIWNMRRYYRYTFDIADLNYVKITTDPTFDSLYSAPKYSVLRYSYSDHFILNARFTLMYDELINAARLNKTYYRIAVETAGNLLYGISYLSGRNKNNDGFYEIGNIPFSQYVKGELAYSYNKYIDRKNRIVYHGTLGVVFPYGNAQIVPFEKRFFGGGANGVRGWEVRTLGPGSFASENLNDFVQQAGDIKLNASIEYRSKLFWKMELAAFLDGGNIWTIRNYESQPGGYFKINEFYKQIALSYGLGLRFDFTYFLIRFDAGVKAYNPANAGSERWRFNGFNWSDDTAFHFAIGYPF